jgi:hypothetical protein
MDITIAGQIFIRKHIWLIKCCLQKLPNLNNLNLNLYEKDAPAIA